MAVNINIPGIGTVSADNAATESTLNSLLAAVRGQNTIIRSNESTLAYAQTLQEKSAQAASNQFGSMAARANQASSSVTRFANEVSVGLDGVKQRSYLLGQYLTDLGASAAGLADRMIMNTSDLAKNPITNSVKTVNTLIDASAGLFKLIVDTFSKSGKIGSKEAAAATERGNKFTNAAKTGIEGTAMVLKYANNFLGAQLQTTMDSFQEFNRTGTVFFGGMTTMKVAAAKAGTLLDQFTLGIRSSIDSVRAMGMGTNHSTLAVARGMEELTKATHSMTIVTRNEKAGVESREVVQSTYRESLKRLGYETEDQVALVADYLSLQRATMSAEQFRAYTNSGLDKEVAVRTLEYAKSLKLIADLTGTNASEVAKEARARSLSALSMQMLEGDQRETFGQVSAMFDKLNVGFINTALEQMVASGGQVIDESIRVLASNFPELQDFLDSTYRSIIDGSMTTKQALTVAAEGVGGVVETLKSGGVDLKPIVAAATLGKSSTAIGVVNILDALTRVTIDGDTAKNIDAATTSIVETPDKLTASLAKISEDMITIGKNVEEAALTVLPAYARGLQTVNETMMNMVAYGLNMTGVVGSIFSGTLGVVTDAVGVVTGTVTKLKSWGGNLVDDVMGDGKIPAGSTGEFSHESSNNINPAMSYSETIRDQMIAEQKRKAPNQEIYAQNNNNNIADNPADKLAEEMKNMVTKLIEQNATTTKILLASQNTANTVDKIYKATVA
jgi:hypothetical protein